MVVFVLFVFAVLVFVVVFFATVVVILIIINIIIRQKFFISLEVWYLYRSIQYTNLHICFFGITVTYTSSPIDNRTSSN